MYPVLIEKVTAFSPLQVKYKPRDREKERAFILGSVDYVVVNNYQHKIFTAHSFSTHAEKY
jgi:hypothetical protein